MDIFAGKLNRMPNLNLGNIQALKEIIQKELTPLIDSDYVLLDVPDYDNIGDNLIWEGELAFLQNIPFKKKYEASYLFFEQSKIPLNSIILFQGGGNFGDIYTKTQKERLSIIKQNPDKKIIIFPQTIHYSNLDNLKKDSIIMNSHPNLHFCVRDLPSLEIIQTNFPKVHGILLPDMAFCMDPKKFDVPRKNHKTLLMARKDGELGKLPDLNFNFDQLDWPNFNMSKEERWKILGRQQRLDKIAQKLQKMPLLNQVVDSRYGLKSRQGRENYIQTGIEFFQNYDSIYTTRLHGLILGIFMDIDMKVLDNSYGKLTKFHQKWLKDFEKVEIYPS